MIINDPTGTALKDYINGNRNGKLIVKCNIIEDPEIPVEYLFRTEAEMPSIEERAL